MLEDEALILLMIENVLVAAGYGVEVAASEQQALAALDTHHFDVAVIDVGLGEGNSFKVAEALTRRRVEFIFCTASSVPIIAPFLDVPVVDKPFAESDLLAAVGATLSMR